eukprot:173304-Pleurochrysis_carterae.AAC.1
MQRTIIAGPARREMKNIFASGRASKTPRAVDTCLLCTCAGKALVSTWATLSLMCILRTSMLPWATQRVASVGTTDAPWTTRKMENHTLAGGKPALDVLEVSFGGESFVAMHRRPDVSLSSAKHLRSNPPAAPVAAVRPMPNATLVR